MTNGSDSGCSASMAPTEHTVSAGGMRWRYLRWGGEGPPFVLWHGVTSDANSWWRVGPFLAAQGFRVYAPDMPGHGLSDASATGYAVAATATLLDEWLEALDLAAPIVLGHSWGGLNALFQATSPGARVRPRALILEDPALRLNPDPHVPLPSFLAGVGSPPTDEIAASLAAANPRWHRCDAWWKARALSRARPEAVRGFFVDNAGIDVASRINQVAVPTLLILGDPASGGIWSAQQIGTARDTATPVVTVQIVAGSTHNLHRDSFEPFSEAVASFVLRNSDGFAGASAGRR